MSKGAKKPKLEKAMKAKKSDMDLVYERGYRQGLRNVPDFSELWERYDYLRAGGSWGVGICYTPSGGYLAGFKDAMRTLGLKP